MAHALLSSLVGRDAFPADPDFPQLPIATDLGRMRDLFRIHLKPVAGRPWHIADCVGLRLRSRQSVSRCVLQYTLRVVDPGTGHSAEHWVSGLLYSAPGEAARLWRELEAGDPRRGIRETILGFEPVGFIPDLEMVLQVFPYDRKLPQLADLLAGAPLELTRQLVRRLGPGEWCVEQHVIEPTRYRTELGAALRSTLAARDLASGARRTVRCYLKVYRDERGANCYELLRRLTDRLRGSGGPYEVARPIVYLPAQRLLALEEARGTSLQQVLLQGGDPAPALAAVARAVATFNQADGGPTGHHSLTEQREELAGAAWLVQWGCPELRPDVAAIVAAVERGLAAVPPAPIHGDLKTEHLFVSGDRVTFVDLDAAVLGDPVRDPAHLFAHIAGRLGLDGLPPERARAAAAAFAREYFRHVPESWRARFPLHCAAALLEVARGIFKRQEQRWREKVAVAIAEARRALDFDATNVSKQYATNGETADGTIA